MATRCRSCQAEVWWSETPAGKRAPWNADGTSHFITCPDRREWRKETKLPPRHEPEPLEPSQPSLLDADAKPTETRYPR